MTAPPEDPHAPSPRVAAPPAPPERAAVLAALDAVIDPVSGRGLVAAGLVQGLAIGPGRAGFMLEAPAGEVERYSETRARAEAALRTVPGVVRAQVVLTADAGEGRFEVQPRAAPAPSPASTGRPSAPPPRAVPTPAPVAHVRKVLAVASGKGGVGKSTVAANLAVALACEGLRVGLMDADVYGPSQPTMMGLSAQPEVGEDRRMIPPVAHGVKVVSIGLIVQAGSPMIWRGPMASSAIRQFLDEVAWGSDEAPLDVLLIDMPPGTGDVQLTLAQRVRIDGAVIVSTPQEVALIDVRRGAGMFAKTGAPVLGVIENMAYFPDPATGEAIEIFGRGGARRVAEEIGAPFLGELPFDVALRRGADAGRPLVATTPDSPVAQAFAAMARRLREALGV